MTSITSWVRLEPRARDRELHAGSEARIHDPLWLLARQWQLGELAGVDAGSAMTARAWLEVSPIDAVRAGDAWTSLDAPLETALDAPAPSVADRVRDGRRLQRMLAQWPTAAALLTRFAFAPDADLDESDRAFCASMAGRVIDGARAASELAPVVAAGDLPSSFGIATADNHAVSDACRAWLASRPAPPLGAWRPAELAARFEARVPSTPPMRARVAREQTAPLAWDDFDVVAGDDGATPVQEQPAVGRPRPVQFRGSPPRRYWDLEDAAVDWTALATNPGDIGRLLAYHLGITFGDHWLAMPLEIPHGTVSRLRSLVVTDTFGTRFLVRATEELDGLTSPARRWRFLQTSLGVGLLGPLVLEPPAVSKPIGERVLAAVDLVRDDIADVLWAIDRTRHGADGEPHTAIMPGPLEDASQTLAYRLGPAVPPTAHPYRARIGTSGLELARAIVPGEPTVERPDLPATIAIHALPKRTMQLRMVAMLVRGPDGRYHSILRRDVVNAVAPAIPLLAFDQLTKLP
jgi:hypothetical protein